MTDPQDKQEREACIECVMTWLLKGDGGVCLACRHAVYWKGEPSD